MECEDVRGDEEKKEKMKSDCGSREQNAKPLLALVTA